MKLKGRWKRAALPLVFCLVGMAAFAACDQPPEEEPGEEETAVCEGWYVLDGKTVQGVDVTEEYLYNCIYFHEGVASWYEIDYSGMSEKSGAYTADETSVVIEIGVRTYSFSFDAQKNEIAFSGKINKQNVVMNYRFDKNFYLPVTENGATFTEELFGESKEENFYNYCPSVMMEGNNVMHVWYCTNLESGIVRDYVGYRKGTLNASGKWEFSEKKIALSPDPDADKWDGKHTCDPSVVKGDFSMNGERYSYLMAYLGCKAGDVNSVGIALSKTPEGPYIKVQSLNPIANYFTSDDYVDDGNYYWGYGQPCVISSDGAGKVLLFYSKGTSKKTCTQVEEWDLSDLGSPQKLRSAEVREKNVVNASGGSDCINNADFSYDPATGRLYCIKEDFPYPSDDTGVTWLTGANTLMYADLGDRGFDLLFDSAEIYSWNVCDSLSADGKTYVRAHNFGIVTDPFGRLVNPLRVPVLYTVSEAASAYPDWSLNGQWPALHTYRIHGYVFEVS